MSNNTDKKLEREKMIFEKLSQIYILMENKGLPTKEANFMQNRVSYCRGI